MDDHRRTEQLGGDYGYDLAHEVEPVATTPRAETHEHPVQVVTESSDAGQDYGYDLAHDVPGREGR